MLLTKSFEITDDKGINAFLKKYRLAAGAGMMIGGGRDEDPRLVTRHFDLLMACAIAWQMKSFAVTVKETGSGYQQPAYERSGLE